MTICRVDEYATDDLPKPPHRSTIFSDDKKKRGVQKGELYIHNLNGEPKNLLLLCLFFMLIFHLPVKQALLVEVPNNTAVFQDGTSEEIVLPCKSDQLDPLRWFMQKINNSGKETLYSGYSLNPDANSYCTVIADEPGQCHLLLKNTPETAQRYICLEPLTLSEASADLIFLGSEFMCNDTSSEEILNVTCNIEFRGNWAPTMEWKKQSNDGEQVLTVDTNTATVPNQRVTSTLVMPVEHGSINYTCTVKFEISGKPLETTATNVPDFEKHWSSSLPAKSQDETPKKFVVTAVIMAVGVLQVGLMGAAMYVSIIIRKRRNENKTRIQQSRRQEDGLISKRQTVGTGIDVLSTPISTI